MNKQKKLAKESIYLTKNQINALVNSYGEIIRQLCEADIRDEKGESDMMRNPVQCAFLIGRGDMLRFILNAFCGIERKDIDAFEDEIREGVSHD